MTPFIRLLRVVAVFASIATVGISSSQPQQPPPVPDTATDLRQRHPEISGHPDFQRWMSNDGGIGPWYETPATPDRIRTVVIQNGAGTRVFGAQVSMAGGLAVRRVAAMDLTATGQTRAEAQQASASRWTAPQIRATRPVIDFLPNDQVRMTWEYEIAAGGKIETYRLQDKKFELRATRDRLPEPASGRSSLSTGRAAGRSGLGRGGGARAMAEPAVSSVAPLPGDTGDDDLHAGQSFAAEAQGWVSGLTTVEAKARRINEQVFGSYSYDLHIVHIAEFTWADVLVRDVNSRAGICDEIAVVAVTYLRSLGIAARVKLLVWTTLQGKSEAHAAVEYFDAGLWHHMDPTWNKFHEPGAYRAAGNTHILVMDTFDPLDSRSNVDAYGVPDPMGDHKLHPYFDYVIPSYPGIQEPGYSF